MTPHRTWFKLLFNPILRKLGWSIVSIFRGDKLLGYQIRPYPDFCKVKGDNSTFNIRLWCKNKRR